MGLVMPQEKIIHGHEVSERVLFINLSSIALVIAGIGLFVFFATFFILFQ
jgi:hypothetical protein